MLVGVVAIIGLIGWRVATKSHEPATTTNTAGTSTNTGTTAATAESWNVESAIVHANRTSTDTHKLADGSYRQFYLDQGQVWYADSVDGISWGTAYPTGLTQSAGTVQSNPGALQLKDGSWILLYEQSSAQAPGESPGQPGPSNRRDLYMATSIDGKTFTKAGIAIDSSKGDNYFASVPDLVLLPDGTVRLFYVSRGNAVASATSTDNGKSWKREAGYRLEGGAVDPDVVYQNGTWVMYYSQISLSTNGIYKAVSSDGLTWRPLGTVLSKTGDQYRVVDPDVVMTSAHKYVMYFGETNAPDTGGQVQIDLHRASYNGAL